jgi:hypothetical protein
MNLFVERRHRKDLSVLTPEDLRRRALSGDAVATAMVQESKDLGGTLTLGYQVLRPRTERRLLARPRHHR